MKKARFSTQQLSGIKEKERTALSSHKQPMLRPVGRSGYCRSYRVASGCDQKLYGWEEAMAGDGQHHWTDHTTPPSTSTVPSEIPDVVVSPADTTASITVAPILASLSLRIECIAPLPSMVYFNLKEKVKSKVIPEIEEKIE